MMNEIIIDGVNVAECVYLKEYKACQITTHLIGEYSKQCKAYNNCYFKQLQRVKAELTVQKAVAKGFSEGLAQTEKLLEKVKAENEELKKENEDLNFYIKEYKIVWEIDKLNKYKQALEDIREILNNYMGDCMVINFNNTVSARNMIKDKLDEVLNANNI